MLPLYFLSRKKFQRRLTMFKSGIILTKLSETQASPEQISSSLNSNDKAKNGAEGTTIGRAR